MPTRRTAVRKPIILKTEEVNIRDLQMYHKNPRVGNVDLIADSLRINGQFKPIVVNVGKKTKRANEILAGNHTYLGARREGWETIVASFVDVDEATAARIVAADNKTADAGTYDEELLADFLRNLPDLAGTGYSKFEVDDILKGVEAQVEEAMSQATKQLEEQEQADEAIRRSGTFDGAPLGEEPDPDTQPQSSPTPVQKTGPTLEEADESLAGAKVLKLPEEMVFPKVGYWGIPALREDMFMQWDEVPDNLDSWAGSATKNWPDPDQWWLYNWGIDSTSGMQDISKVIVGFYAWDQYFDKFWDYPDRYVTKILNSGIKYILTPNYSQWFDNPRAENLWALYKARLLGRYFQECGLKLVPDIEWPFGDIDYLEQHVLATLPDKVPVIALQLQNFDDEGAKNKLKDYKAQYQLIVDTLSPDGIIVYAGKRGHDWFLKNVRYRGELKLVGTRMEKLSEQAKSREKKTTI